MCRPYKQTLLGFSVYLSTFGEVYPFLKQYAGNPGPVFTSLHISEEFDLDYIRRTKEMLEAVNQLGFQIIADVSQKTLAQFGQPDLFALAKELNLWGLRLDYGFDLEEMIRLSQKLPIALNASTIDLNGIRQIKRHGGEVIGFHNFYPRPETGLGQSFFRETSNRLRAEGILVYCFIPGDEILRGPVFEGLPTLEHHRKVKPLAAYGDIVYNEMADAVFVGDGAVSRKELKWIGMIGPKGVLPVPAFLAAGYEALYGRKFTCRPDSPELAVRFQESREYSCFGKEIPPGETKPRPFGTITIDNLLYGRYSGEIQLMRKDLPPDKRVNVIGHVAAGYELLISCIHNRSAFCLVRP